MKMQTQVRRGIEASEKALARLMSAPEFTTSSELEKALKEHAKRVRKCKKELSKQRY